MYVSNIKKSRKKPLGFCSALLRAAGAVFDRPCFGACRACEVGQGIGVDTNPAAVSPESCRGRGRTGAGRHHRGHHRAGEDSSTLCRRERRRHYDINHTAHRARPLPIRRETSRSIVLEREFKDKGGGKGTAAFLMQTMVPVLIPRETKGVAEVCTEATAAPTAADSGASQTRFCFACGRTRRVATDVECSFSTACCLPSNLAAYEQDSTFLPYLFEVCHPTADSSSISPQAVV